MACSYYAVTETMLHTVINGTELAEAENVVAWSYGDAAHFDL